MAKKNKKMILSNTNYTCELVQKLKTSFIVKFENGDLREYPICDLGTRLKFTKEKEGG